MFQDKIPNNWEKIAHHMTINMNSIQDGPLANTPINNELVDLIATDYDMDERVLAVKVSTEAHSTNTTKHITVAVNRLAGGKPFHSNQLMNWKNMSPVHLKGRIEEVK